MDERLHVALHVGATRRAQLGVVHHHRARVGAQPVDALGDDAVRLAHFLDPHQVAVVAVAVRADRDVEIHPVVDFIGLLLAQVPGDAGAADHRAREPELQRALRRDHADVHRALFPDAVVREQGLVIVDGLRKAFRERLDEVEHAAAARLVELVHFLLGAPARGLVLRHAVRQVAMDAARTVIGGVHASAGDGLVHVHELLALLEAEEEHRHRADVEAVRAEPHEVVQDARDLVEHHADVLRALGGLDAEQPLDGEHVRVLVTHHGHVVEPVHVADGLVEGLGLGQLLGAAVQQPDVRIGLLDDLAIELEHQAQHAVRRRMLRPEVHRVVSDFRAHLAGISALSEGS